ncbi:MAG: tRNA (adenosine(37)-N6)-threonylcarbamoyltransferase complex ATPase subunit type 1 TsaE [Patescibacteria group bacterium]
MIIVASDSDKTTQKIGERLARTTSRIGRQNNHALVFGLKGGLGAGKTTFIKGFVRGLGYKKRVTSPTFLIFKRLELKNKKFKNVFHVDAYRVRKPSDLNILGFKRIVDDPKNIVLVEWANKIKGRLPENMIWVRFDYGKNENERKIIMNT